MLLTRPPRQLAPALAFLLTLLTLPVLAEPVWVFVDNSGSMNSLARTYRADMKRLITDGAPERLYFAAIEGGNGSVRVVDSGARNFAQRVNDIFTFKGSSSNTTPIDASLARAEQDPRFAAAARVLIISDMDPDHEILSEPFHFSRADINDLKATLARLDRWLAAGRPIRIVLHGWERAPSPTDYPKAELDRFPQDLDQAIADLRAAQSPPAWQPPGPTERFVEPAAAGLTGVARAAAIARIADERRALVARGLAHLADRYPGLLELRHIAPTQNGVPNEDGFRASLCDALGTALGAADVACPDNGVANFRIEIDYSNHLLPPQLRPRVLRGFPASVTDGTMPRTVPRPQVNIGLAGPEDPNLTVRFRVLPGQRGMVAFQYPRIEASGRSRDGTTVSLPAVEADYMLEDRERMVDWSVNAMAEMLSNFVRDYYPPEARLKKLWLTGADGRPVDDGLYFKFAYDNGTGELFNSAIVSTRDGGLELRLPVEFQQGELFLVDQETGEPDYPDGVPLSPTQVRQPSDIEARLGASDLLRTRDLTFCLADTGGNCPPYLGEVDLRLFRVNPDESRVESRLNQPRGAQLVHLPDGVRLERLFPGTYIVEAVPLQETGHLAALTTEFNAADQGPVMVRFDPDLLATGWDDKAYEFQPLPGGRGTFTRDAINHLRGSAWYLERLLDHSNQVMGDNPVLDLAGNPAHKDLRALWLALRGEVFDGQVGLSYGRWLTRALAPFFQSNADGSLPNGSMRVLQAMFNRFLECRDPLLDPAGPLSPGGARTARYDQMLRGLRESGLLSDGLYARLASARPPEECQIQ